MLGIGYGPAHHGEILQGVFRDGTGELRIALVTLPYPKLGSLAMFRCDYSQDDITCDPALPKVRQAAALAMAEFSVDSSSVTGGQLTVSSNVPRGIGMGSSTADVIATIRAVADSCGVKPSSKVVSRIAVQAEYASDATMIEDEVVLFAQREGSVLETLGCRLPSMIVIGCDAHPGCNGIDTLSIPLPAYTSDDIEIFGILRNELRRAVGEGDVARLGIVATASARISQRFVPKSAFEFLVDTCQMFGGCGVQVSHSGTVAGIVFDPRVPGIIRNVQRCIARIHKAGLRLTAIIAPEKFYSGLQGQNILRSLM